MKALTAKDVRQWLLVSVVLLGLISCGGGNSSSPTTNSEPIANAGSDQMVTAQSEVTLAGSGTDSDGSIESYRWSQTTGASVTLNNANSADANFTAPISETVQILIFELTVTDNDGATGTDLVEVTVNPGKTFYVDPVNGSIGGDGSINSPWHKIQDLFDQNLIASKRWSTPYATDSTLDPINEGAPVQAGDTVILYSGYHGDLEISRYVNDAPITIKAADGQSPQISSLHIQSSSNWIIDGLSISHSYYPVPGQPPYSSLVFVESHNWRGPSSHIDLLNNTVFSVTDASNWSAEEWLTNVASGIRLQANHSTIINNSLSNIGMGISVESDFVEVKENSIINFSGDGIRGLGDNGLFEYNLIANGFKVDENHDDGFQSFVTEEESVKNVTLRGNKIYYNLNHPNVALISDIQGIGCFDGFYENWVIENNLVVVNHWHGITLMGARNSVIVNNTVVDLNPNDPGPPWIRISPHKNGTHGEGNRVFNNLGLINVSDRGTTVEYNLDPTNNLFDLFVSPQENNFSLKTGATAIDAGLSSVLTPSIDITGRERTGIPDIGAYEYHTDLSKTTQ